MATFIIIETVELQVLDTVFVYVKDNVLLAVVLVSFLTL
jgi:hypothetical protein